MKLIIRNASEEEQILIDELKQYTDIFSAEAEEETAVLYFKRYTASAAEAPDQTGTPYVRNFYISHDQKCRNQNAEDRDFEVECNLNHELDSASGTYLVTYTELPQLCRALLYLSGLQKAPAGDVTEAAAFTDFGVMMDCSRNAVPKVSTVKKMIRYAACMGYGFVGLYMEDTFFVKEEPYLGYMRGRLMQDEIKELDAYAQKFGVELRPFIQTLAHVNQITRYEHYQNFIDTQDVLLVGDKRTEEFLDHVLQNVKACFTTNRINIGMDEAFLLGSGKFLTQNGFSKKSDIMLRHLHTVLDLCEKYGLKAQMWSDMFEHMADAGEKNFKIPENVRIAYWDYYSTDKAHYLERMNKHLSFCERKQLSFAGGAWKWTGFVPHNGYSIEIGKAAMAACKESGISSFTVTCWGDNGAEASHFSVLPALYGDANCCYKSEMPDASFQKLTGYTWDEFMQIDLVNPYSEQTKMHNNCSKYLLYNDPLIGTFDSVLKADTPDRFAAAARELKKPQSHGTLAYLFQTMQRLSTVLISKSDLGKRIRLAYEKNDKTALTSIATIEIPEILAELDAFYEAFAAQWETENKSFGFEVQTIRIGGLKQRLTDTKKKLLKFTEHDTKMEELEQPMQPFCYFEKNDIEELNYNLWSDIVSPSVIG